MVHLSAVVRAAVCAVGCSSFPVTELGGWPVPEQGLLEGPAIAQ